MNTFVLNPPYRRHVSPDKLDRKDNKVTVYLEGESGRAIERGGKKIPQEWQPSSTDPYDDYTYIHTIRTLS